MSIAGVKQELTSANEDQACGEGALMRRVAAGDAKALEQMIAQYGAMLNRLIGRLTSWSSDREDLLQDVFLAVWQKADRFQDRGSLEGWLRQVAINRCRNHHRWSKRFRAFLEQFKLIAPGRRSTSDESKLDERQSIEAALAHLNSSDRMVLVLYYLEEMPAGEVAESLGIRVETFHVRLHRARNRLKEQLA